MHWRLKALAQNAIARLPAPLSHAVYYQMQRRFGALRASDPRDKLLAAIAICRYLVAHGRSPVDRVFLEVGTGRTITLPIAFWLMGAHRTITVDVNPYLKAELVLETLGFIRCHRDEIQALFGPLLMPERWAALAAITGPGKLSLAEIAEFFRVDYVAPGDAAITGLSDASIDVHTSYTVLEHIPEDALHRILTEGSRIIARDGLLVHRIDYSDHFSHADKSLSAIHFLRYPEAAWERLAGNRYMYMNRLRHDDFIALLEGCGQRIIAADVDVDPALRHQLRRGLVALDARFVAKPERILATTGAWVVSERSC